MYRCSCSTGIPYDGYEKLFVFSKDSLLSDILAYAFFNMKLEEIQKEEVSNVEWNSYDEIEEKYNNDEFVPHWWEYIKNDIKKYFN